MGKRGAGGSAEPAEPPRAAVKITGAGTLAAAGRVSASSGLSTPMPTTLSTWVSIIVVLTAAWPSSSCTVR